MIIKRTTDIEYINRLLSVFPVAAILGTRQCGKTTLAKQLPYDHYFDLENPRDLARLEQPQLTLENLTGLIVIDEIQRAPEVFPLLRFLVDTKKDQKYLILGSASRDLIRQSSESLAGRIGYHHLHGFSLSDVGIDNYNKLWIQGSYPRSYLARTEDESWLWRENYIRTILERDIPQLIREAMFFNSSYKIIPRNIDIINNFKFVFLQEISHLFTIWQFVMTNRFTQ